MKATMTEMMKHTVGNQAGDAMTVTRWKWMIAMSLLAACVFLTVSAIGQVKPQTVLVVNGAGQPVPTAAQGTTNVAGTVSIGNTPNVNVANTPSVSIAGTPTVMVGNTVHLLDAERLARIPYQSNQFTVGGCVSCRLSFTAAPPGYRLVLQHISAQLQGSTQLALSIGTGFGSQASWTLDGTLGASNICGINQDLLAYFDPADGQPSATVPGGGVLNGTVTLTGYLENCSITGCPAIQH